MHAASSRWQFFCRGDAARLPQRQLILASARRPHNRAICSAFRRFGTRLLQAQGKDHDEYRRAQRSPPAVCRREQPVVVFARDVPRVGGVDDGPRRSRERRAVGAGRVVGRAYNSAALADDRDAIVRRSAIVADAPPQIRVPRSSRRLKSLPSESPLESLAALRHAQAQHYIRRSNCILLAKRQSSQ